MEMQPLDWYWAHVGVVLMAIMVGVNLIASWAQVYDEPKTAPSGAKNALIKTAIFVGSLGMLTLGFGPKAPTDNIHLEGAADHTHREQALEAEIRSRDEIIIRTRAELENHRQVVQQLKKDIEQQLFKKDIEEGQDHMNTTRKRIMERED